MKRIVEHQKTFTNLIVNPSDIFNLANICNNLVKQELIIAEKKWETIELPNLIKKIDEHNKQVNSNKSTYSFNTYLDIGEKDREAIIEKEHDFFIYTTESIYPFNLKFFVEFPDNTIEETTPEFLKEINLEESETVSISSKSSEKERSINIKIYNKNYTKHLLYSVRGDSNWVTIQEQKIENIIKQIQKPKQITKYKLALSIGVSLITCLTIFKLISKIGFKDITLIMMLGPLLLMILISIFQKLWNNILPNFTITKEYEPFQKNKIFNVMKGIFTAIAFPWIYDFFRWIF